MKGDVIMKLLLVILLLPIGVGPVQAQVQL